VYRTCCVRCCRPPHPQNYSVEFAHQEHSCYTGSRARHFTSAIWSVPTFTGRPNHSLSAIYQFSDPSHDYVQDLCASNPSNQPENELFIHTSQKAKILPKHKDCQSLHLDRHSGKTAAICFLSVSGSMLAHKQKNPWRPPGEGQRNMLPKLPRHRGGNL
jgi:hypothetical protein